MNVDLVYGYCVRHGGIGRVLSELLGRIAHIHEFRVLTLECTVSLPSRVELCKVGCKRDGSFMSQSENLAFSTAVKTLRRTGGKTMSHAFGVYDLEPDLYSAAICLAGYFKAFTEFFGTGRLTREIPSWESMQALEENMLGRLNARNVITCSGSVSRELEAFYGIEGISVVPNASRLRVEREGIDDRERGARQRFTIGLIGNNLYGKGLVFAKDAMNRLTENMPISCLAAGCDGATAAYMAKNARYAFETVGRVDLGTGFYNKCDCLLFPSIYEAHSLSILEAMSAGVPVVFSKSTGNYEDVRDLPELAVAAVEDPSDTVALTGAVERVLTDENYRSELIESGMRVAGLYSWDVAADAYLQAYCQIGALA